MYKHFAVCMCFFADGDKKAHYENTQFEMEKNRTQIQHLRRENKELRAKLAKKMAVSNYAVTYNVCIIKSIMYYVFIFLHLS